MQHGPTPSVAPSNNQQPCHYLQRELVQCSKVDTNREADRGRPVHNFVDKVDMESADEFVRYFFKCKHVL